MGGGAQDAFTVQPGVPRRNPTARGARPVRRNRWDGCGTDAHGPRSSHRTLPAPQAHADDCGTRTDCLSPPGDRLPRRHDPTLAAGQRLRTGVMRAPNRIRLIVELFLPPQTAIRSDCWKGSRPTNAQRFSVVNALPIWHTACSTPLALARPYGFRVCGGQLAQLPATHAILCLLQWTLHTEPSR